MSQVADPYPATPGQTIQLPCRVSGGSGETFTVVQTSNLKIIHLLMPAGQSIPTYEAHGEVVLHCLEAAIFSPRFTFLLRTSSAGFADHV